MREMEYSVNGRRVYYSTFDEGTGNVVRLVEDLGGDDWALEKVIHERFQGRYNEIPSPSPELCDISITDKCGFGCDFCYQDSKPNLPHGHTDLVETILKGFETVPYQIAIGGGEPTQHPDFPHILRKARELGTVPNYTTAGFRMTPEIVAATNEVCGGVAMTYHSFKGLDWFKDHYKRLKDQLRVKLNVHLIADKNVSKNLRDLADAQDELGHLSVVLLAYYPDVGRATVDKLMTRTTYMKTFPAAITYARGKAVDISFSEGLLAYFLSRPELGINTQFAMRSEGVFSCYIDPRGRMSHSSFDSPHSKGQTVFETTSQNLWEHLYGGHSEPSGEACLENCRLRGQCSTPSDSHYLICAFALHNKLPLDTQEEPVVRKTLFEIISEDD
jgi:MoaA/NifB/PqqE/SkfB family radical SAM enzyme